eukprot:TRINITY_DN11009_c1_g2_i1.p1 TRINITY_DN11009_c1_g2~~TRINITY_DN11009_c1_g2_i1.p1  ORF type:complete len:126 (-),score=1.20 TRINITY_DN11009_c1_g2_i1:31-408(-)
MRHGSCCAKLILLLSSHKEAGNVGTRPVHSMPYYNMASCFMVASVLKTRLEASRVVLNSSAELVSRLESVEARPHHILLKLGVKSFCLSGVPHELAVDASLLFNDDPVLRSLVFDVVCHLSHQLF